MAINSARPSKGQSPSGRHKKGAASRLPKRDFLARHETSASTFPRWANGGSLFGELSEDFQKALELFPEAIKKVWKLPASKRKYLPADIADLSRLLTRGRSELSLPYWHKAANLSAYLYYFLPWNIIRLGRLLSSLPLPDPETLDGRLPVLADIGSGPLALPIALWLARKDWRKVPLTVLALDSSRQPMEIGRALFTALAGLMGAEAWQTDCFSGPAERPQSAFQALQGKNPGLKFYPWLLAEANILNELLSKNPVRNGKREEPDEDEDSDHEDADCENSLLGRLLNSWLPVWQNSPAEALALFVEPGTRLGGDAVMNLRRCALNLGFTPLAPCTHANNCPLLARVRRQGSQAESWCHFTFSALSAPQWLKELSRESGLEKTSLSLSVLLLGEKKACAAGKSQSRIISQPFRVPGLQGEARYACSAQGLELLENAAHSTSGSLTYARRKQPLQKDKKSGAPVCVPRELSSAEKVFGKRHRAARNSAIGSGQEKSAWANGQKYGKKF